MKPETKAKRDAEEAARVAYFAPENAEQRAVELWDNILRGKTPTPEQLKAREDAIKAARAEAAFHRKTTVPKQG